MVLMHERLRSAPGKRAKISRSAEVRSCRSVAHRRRSWTRPFHRTRHAIERALHLIDSSAHVVEAAERFAARHPVRAARDFERASAWTGEAMAQLSRAANGLRDTADHVRQTPDVAADAPALLLDASARWFEAALRLDALSARLSGTSAWLRDAVKGGAIPVPFEEQTADPRQPVVFRLTHTPIFPPERLSLERNHIPAIPTRRRRSTCRTVAEAARRIFRGRAPPLVSTCPL